MPGRASRAALWAREQAPFLLVVAAVGFAVLYLLVQPGHWVRGTLVIAGAVLVGGVLRLVLPASRAGLLAVRGRVVDTVVYLVLGVLILTVDLRLHR